MKENNPGRNKEDIEDDEDDEEKESNKKTTKIPRRVAGISLNNTKEPPPSRQEERVARIIDTLFKEKPEKAEDDEEDEEKSDGAVDEPVESPAADNEADTAPESTDDTDELEVPSPLEPEPIRYGRVEVPYDWEEEGELGEDAEINLQAPRRTETDKPAEETETTDTTESETEEEHVPLSDDGGETPPPDTPEDALEETPEPEPRPTPITDSSDGSGFTPYEARRTREPAEEARDYEEALNDAEYRGEKRGQNRGVVAGLAAGLYIGHRRKKQQGKEYDNKLQARDSEINKLHDEQLAAHERVNALRRNQETIQSALNEQQKKPPQAPLEAPTARHEADKPLISSILEGRNPEPLRREVPKGEIVEQRPERELPPEEREITEETYKTADGRRVESSSWHRIEVDAKTGHAVENPDVEYGEEFKRETRREILAAAKDDARAAAVQLGSMATTASAVGAAASGVHSPTSDNSKPAQANKSTPETKEPLQPKATDKQISGVSAAARDPIMWAAGVALIVILIILASLF